MDVSLRQFGILPDELLNLLAKGQVDLLALRDIPESLHDLALKDPFVLVGNAIVSADPLSKGLPVVRFEHLDVKDLAVNLELNKEEGSRFSLAEHSRTIKL